MDYGKIRKIIASNDINVFELDVYERNGILMLGHFLKCGYDSVMCGEMPINVIKYEHYYQKVVDMDWMTNI